MTAHVCRIFWLSLYVLVKN